MHKHLKTSLEVLTAVSNRSALHALDEDRIKLHLRVLAKHDVPLDANEIQAWLLVNHWQPGPVKQVVAWAKSIAEGGRVQIRNASSLPSEADVWRRVQESE